ncbi:universal stress protein [Baekduia alba]|uniref:universal stress protein n=1 Tax=Baekduia alba TaxID=2997333 RepID=UPI0023422063|nr:universal stress protein [Baekduia alba]
MTLVVGYDGTQGARAAFDEALTLAERLGESVHVVFSFASPRLGGELHDLDEAIRERGDAVVGEALKTAAAAGVAVSSDVRMQDPAEGLLAAADEVGAT